MVGGFRLNTSFDLGEQAGNNGKHRLGTSLTDSNGPLALAVATEHNKAQLDAGDTRQQDLMLAGSYDFGIAKSFVQLARHTMLKQDIEYRTSQLGVWVPVGSAVVLASWGHTQYTSPISRKTRNSITTVYDYFLSRRTDV